MAGGNVSERASFPQTAQQPTLGSEDLARCGSISSWRRIFEVPAVEPPTLGLHFLRAAEDTTTIVYSLGANPTRPSKDGDTEKAHLILGQEGASTLGVGAVVWDCGEDLATFLGRQRFLVAGMRVLDLGTGTGIAGLAAAQCGAREVILTDHPALENLVRSNVERNAGFAKCSVSFSPFDWENTTAEEIDLASPDDPFDLVLASDCVYEPAAFLALKKALLAVCGPQTILVMAYKRRLDREKDFFEDFESDFDVALVAAHHHQPLVASSGLAKAAARSSSPNARGVYMLLAARRGYRGDNSTINSRLLLDALRVVR